MESIRRNIGVIITIALQTAAIVWWASGVNAQVTQSTADIADLKAAVAGSNAVILTREQLNDILAARDAKIDNLKEELGDFKSEMRSGIQRIENKLK